MFRLPLVLLLLISQGNLWVEALDDDDTREHWVAFKEKYNKTYDSEEEEAKGRKNFETNLLHVALHNVKDEHAYDKDLHEYSDLSPKEMIKSLCGTKRPTEARSYEYENFSISERSRPTSLNWVTKGKVSAVKSQGDCSSCWSFAAAQAIESQEAIKRNTVPILSEQQLVDCSGSYGNGGCSGGWPQSAFEYIKDNGGLVEESDYPYTAQDGVCDIPEDGTRHKITGYKNVGPADDEEAVANALATKGPLSAAIYVSDDFGNYGEGVFTDTTYNGEEVNHGVLIVGYGTQDGQDYWLIKNSWGPSWGEKGYMKLRRNYKSHLHIATYASYPTL